MVIAGFQVEDKANRSRFYYKTYLMANTKFEVILGILFLKISNADMSFGKKILIWKTYITNKALPITKLVHIVNPKEFIIAVLNIDNEMFVMHVAISKREKMLVHSKKQAKVGALLFDKVFSEVPAKYSNYSNVFSAKNIAELLKNTGINEYTIKLKKDKQPSFGPNYSLEPVELETLKIYIEINLANGFI